MANSPDDYELTTSRMSYRCLWLSGNVVWFQCAGYVTAETWAPSERILERVIAHRGSVLMMCNGLEWTNYETGYRTGVTRWFLARREQLHSAHILIRSPFVRMGVQVVNLAVPALVPYDDARAFRAFATREVPNLDATLRAKGLPVPA